MINNLSTRYLAFADPDMRVRIYCDSDYLDEYLHICEVCKGMSDGPEGLFVEFNAKVLTDTKRIFETCGCKLNSICVRDQLSVTCTESYRRVFTSKLEVMADGQVYLLFNYDGNSLIHELNLTSIIIILWLINLFISLCPGSNLLKLPLIKVPPYYFYVPGSSSVLDQVLMRNGILTDIGMYSGKSLSEDAIIDSTKYKGKLRGDEIHVTRHSICGEFCNDNTGTIYEIPLRSMLDALRTANTPADQ